jgi:serine/threonine-protein kinase RsbT
MEVGRADSLPITSDPDIVRVRQAVRAWAVELGFGTVDQTKLVTAASELARNALTYGGGGACRIEVVRNGLRTGLRLTFEDKGPGIPDVTRAMTDGYTTGTGMGLGLGGSKRLVNDFEIESQVGVGTRVRVARWR